MPIAMCSPPHPGDASDPAGTFAQLTVGPVAVVNGPYTDKDSAEAAALTAETIRYLNYAAARGGVAGPATIAALTGNLAAACYRLHSL